MTDERIAGRPVEETSTRWRLRTVLLRIDGERRLLRLVRFRRVWLASTDSVRGPTLGHDASPYLAARRALEPLGVSLVDAMTAVGSLGCLVATEPGAIAGREAPAADPLGAAAVDGQVR